MQEGVLRIVIVGHVDHGKSTLIGRLLYDTQSLPEDKLKEIEKVSEKLGKEVEFAFVMDSFEKERTEGMTIDTTQTFFRTKKRRYVIIDAPGHKEFLKNMITGSSQAEAAVLIVDVNEGVKEQTRRHAYILKLLGLKQVCVVINKMDMVNYLQERFKQVSEEVVLYLGWIGIKPSFIIPISALKGDNIATTSQNLKWFSGGCVLDALDSFLELKVEQKPFKFPVQDIYKIDGKNILVGRVEAGEIKVGETVYVLPQKKQVRIKNIEKFLQNESKEARYGEAVGLCVDDVQDIKRGTILSKDLNPKITRKIKTNIFWMENIKTVINEKLAFRCVTQEAGGRIVKLYKKFDPASMEVVEEDAKEIKGGEVAEAEIVLDNEVVICSFNDIPEMGRFVLEKEQNPVAGGIILSA